MLKVIELFAGIGSQTQALKNIGVPHEVTAISEIDKYALKSYEALHGRPNNLGDIKGIAELPRADLWTYSFPCVDVSICGAMRGLSPDTRSGLLFEVRRLLHRAADSGTLPKYLLLENVKNLIGRKFKADYEKWLAFLSSLGYTTYWDVLNAKHYGVPQNRERVFAVSIFGGHTPYIFPEKRELRLRLRDVIDHVVDEKYYLSGRLSAGLLKTDTDGREPRCVQAGILSGGKWDKMHDISRRVYATDGIAPTLHCMGGGNTEIKIAAMRGRDKPDGGRKQMLEVNDRGTANTLTTVQKDNLVLEYGAEGGIRIRKLTPRECLRLMGWTDAQADKIFAAGISDTQVYRQAGNGIVIQVLEAVFKRLFL